MHRAVDLTNAQPPRARKWSREEYYRMAEAGLFEGQRVQLIDGDILEMSPQGYRHAQGIGLVQASVQRVFSADVWIRVQLPLTCPDGSEPEPDIAVVRGSPRDYPQHPTTALLVVEVSDASSELDLGKKTSLYASTGIDDYWVVDMVENCVHIFRKPVKDLEADFGVRYSESQQHSADAVISPLAKPDAIIMVADLLP
ncbi:MAG: Uma2 family endonuclease [Planctomycetia bacterium]|nr:Uma2 family endonuclease [Planctomycetia bacterium]